jgi:hypothetical protein
VAEKDNTCRALLLPALQFISPGPGNSAAVQVGVATMRGWIAGGFAMDLNFAAAIEHLQRMEARIASQRAAIERLTWERGDSAAARRRLALLEAALGEMRIQLAQLSPTAEQVSAPTWALPLIADQR